MDAGFGHGQRDVASGCARRLSGRRAQSTDRCRCKRRNFRHERRTPVRGRLDLEATVEQREPLLHPEEAEAVLTRLVHRETAPVVLEHGRNARAPPREHDAHPARLRVFDDVRQSLLDDPVEGGLDLGR